MAIDNNVHYDFKINGLKPGIVCRNRDILKNCTVYTDPTGKYAVAEVFKNELYVAIIIENTADDLLVGKYVNHYSSGYDIDIPMFMKFDVDWGCIGYGFCKLKLWAPELVNKYGSFEHTEARFYFDWELYKSKYEEIHGIPCTKKDPNDTVRRIYVGDEKIKEIILF